MSIAKKMLNRVIYPRNTQAYSDARTSTSTNRKEYETFIYYPSLNIAKETVYHVILTNQLYASLLPGFEHFWRRMVEITPNEESKETTFLYTRWSKCMPFFNSSSETVINPESLQPSAKGTLHISKLTRNLASMSSLIVQINQSTLLLSEGKMHKIQPHKTST